MTRKVKSQWEFGELFPAEATRRIYSVAELTATVKGLLERELGQVWVTGEISNLRRQGSGHMYFTLKDATAQISCVLFRGAAVAARDALEDGLKVILQGDLTVYEPRGQYQLVVRALELQGVGALQLAFERLKRKLDAEGLFAPDRKRPIPRFARRIGLVTSPTGAAIRDVLHVIRRRQPGLEIVFAPCRVQGEGAAAEIAAAIGLLNDWSARAGEGGGLDLVLITRGGGSLEDLWAFNEEVVARAIAASAVPVMSAVGHEIDFTIGDFVADLRAATPSAAAELITEGPFASRQFMAACPGRLGQLARRQVAAAREGLEQATERLAYLHPRRRLNERLQRLDDLLGGLIRGARVRWREHAAAGRQLHARLTAVRPARSLDRWRLGLQALDRRRAEVFAAGLRDRRRRFDAAGARLRLLSPMNVLERGYSITTDDASGAVLRTAAGLTPGQRLRTRFHQGEAVSVVATADLAALAKKSPGAT